MSLTWETTPSSAFRVSPTTVPDLPLLALSEQEQQLIKSLESQSISDRADLELEDSFYRAEMLVQNLRIAIPDELWNRLKVLLGWGRIAVDPYVERLSCEGFRLPGGTDVDERLAEVWDLNGLAAEQSLAFTDALSMRRAYWMVGSDPDGSDMPRITVESPLNVAVQWDGTGRRAKAALQAYTEGGQERRAIMLPEQTIQIAMNDRKEWEIVSRDQHGFGYVPLVRMANDPRTTNRNGVSQITPSLRSLIVSACQREVELAIASNLYSVPRLMLLGAALSDFQDAGGKAIDAWKSYISLINVLERDENGDMPEVKQLQTYDPSTYTKVVDHLASQAAGELSAVPQDLGLYTEGNPTSVEAYQVAEGRRDRRAEMKKRTFGVDLANVMKLSMRFQNNGSLPREFERISTDWADLRMQSTGVVTDAVTKQIQSGAIPATSDVTLKRLGYSAVERAQLEQDRGPQRLDEIRQALANAPQRPQQQPAQAPVTDGNPASA